MLYKPCSIDHMQISVITKFYINELVFVKQKIPANAYPNFLNESMTYKFFNSKLTGFLPILTVGKKPIYFALPYFGYTSK